MIIYLSESRQPSCYTRCGLLSTTAGLDDFLANQERCDSTAHGPNRHPHRGHGARNDSLWRTEHTCHRSQVPYLTVCEAGPQTRSCRPTDNMHTAGTKGPQTHIELTNESADSYGSSLRAPRVRRPTTNSPPLRKELQFPLLENYSILMC